VASPYPAMSPTLPYPGSTGYAFPPPGPDGMPPTGYPMAYPGPYPYLPPPVYRANNGLATASLVLSIVGGAMVFCYGLGFLAALVGAILGHVARRQIRQRDEGGAGLALAGIIIGWIVVGIVAILAGLLIGLAVFSSNNPDYFD
ncbi:MAG TPA: DUF4190 domain-containing protein, partial [Micromonosporaceae bacterium]